MAKQEKGLAKANQFTQQDIPALLEKVNEQMKLLKGGLPAETKTTGELQGFGKIAAINSVSKLIMAHSSVTNRAKAYKSSAIALLDSADTPIKIPAFSLDGSSESAWVEDIQARVLVVAHKTQLDKLSKIKKELEDRMSEEDKFAKTMQNIAGVLLEDEK